MICNRYEIDSVFCELFRKSKQFDCAATQSVEFPDYKRIIGAEFL